MAVPDHVVTVRFFSTAKRLFGAREVIVEPGVAADVRGLLESVCDTPERTGGVFAAPGALRGDIAVLVNGRNIALADGLSTPVGAGDVIAVVPPMAGG